MKSPILAVLAPMKGKGESSKEVSSAPEDVDEKGGDYRSLMKEAAEDGDWDGFVEALCSYVDSK